MNNSKRRLRDSLLGMRSRMTEEQRGEADRKIALRLLDMPIYQSCSRIFLYASKGEEVSTRIIMDTAYAQGKLVALPKSHTGGAMDFYAYDGVLTEGRFGIPEPTGSRIVTPLPEDLMIVPGLSFTREGARIGYGGGYYDRYLAKHPCRTIGLCRDVFLLNEIPTAWNDLPVDCVITEYAAYTKKNGASCEAPLM